eukprot:TRINITY_DN50417_c0_g1_i1.p1 TRINITY_DN50417_c0_g1~~TRINITY_DN50417_c0_g1_i1.p1  ORF type:complete len:476 (+),score=85.81 TRINITY_DN50417_c0_g1_i1:83-1510(+)
MSVSAFVALPIAQPSGVPLPSDRDRQGQKSGHDSSQRSSASSGRRFRDAALLVSTVAACGQVARKRGRGRRDCGVNRCVVRLHALPRPSTDDPKGLIPAAKRYFGLGNKVKQQLGPTEKGDLERELAEDFEFVAPLVGPLGKGALIAATTGLDLSAALPDFDARYHDFRMDRDNPQRVWCQMRVCGRQTGELKFAGVEAKPKDPPTYVENPPEAVSLTFNDKGQVREITTGYPVDRRCGTTGGLGGLFGILEGLGYPLPVILTRTCGEIFAPVLGVFGLKDELNDPELMKVQTLSESDALPGDRLLQLTEQLLEAKFGLSDETLLADSFAASGPAGGALGKKAYLDMKRDVNVEEAFPDLQLDVRDVRICPYDVNRVWFTSSPSGTHSKELRLPDTSISATGKKWVSAPECSSVQFDKDGKCIALTSGYVMDRRLGNTNGLGGVLGLREAIGQPAPQAWLCRTPTQLWNSVSGSS